MAVSQVADGAALSLNSRDVRRLQHAAGILASPLAFATTDDWRRAVTAEIKPLLGADLASFLLPTAATPMMSEDQLPTSVHEYPRIKSELDARFGFPRRELELRVWSRDLLWASWLEELYGGWYYNEYIRPLRCFDAVAMTVDVPGSALNAALYCHHERETGPRFGARGLAVLGILYPAFAAGTRAVATFDAHRQVLGRTIDALDIPCALYTAEGACMHATPALRALLADAQLGPLLRQTMCAAARAVGYDLRDAAAPRLKEPDAVACVVRDRGMTYRLLVTSVGVEGVGSSAILLVRVTSSQPLLPSEAMLRQQYGLTTREAEIARYIAEGLTSHAIADRCGLSPHTVRRHTERVFARLGVHSRAAVAARVTNGR